MSVSFTLIMIVGIEDFHTGKGKKQKVNNFIKVTKDYQEIII